MDDVLTGSGAIVIRATAAAVTVGLNDTRQVGVDNTIIPGMSEGTGAVRVVGSAQLID